MLRTDDGSKYSGKFDIDNKEIDGELTFAGADTHLLLHHPEFFRPDNIDNQCVCGTLRDLTRVSLLHCLAPSVSGSSWSQHLGSYETANIRPHFVLHGRRHLMPTDKLLKSIHFVLKDASAIFPDYNSFSLAHAATPDQLRSLLKEKQKLTKRRARVGKYPIIAYFTGDHNVFKANTVLGKISARHQPSFGSVGPNGVSITNKIAIQVTFPKLVNFTTALNVMGDVLPFFEIIAGRHQEIEYLSVELNEKDMSLSILDVYWCNPPRRERLAGHDTPHPIDLPIDATREPKVFANVLTNWLERQGDWKEARSRFSTSFAKESFFDPDRLIGSANMFDLLPKSAVPQSISLNEDLRAARDASKSLFRALPASAERDSVLAALGRLGHATLKRKVRHRAEMVINVLGSELPNFFEILDLAVDARNHFVHGTESNIDYVGNFFETVAFFSKALEFVFVVSDLLEAGWDIQGWRQRGTTLSHPCASFLYNYPLSLDRLREVLPHGHKLKMAN